VLGFWGTYLTKEMLSPLSKIVGLLRRIQFLKTITVTMKMTTWHASVFWPTFLFFPIHPLCRGRVLFSQARTEQSKQNNVYNKKTRSLLLTFGVYGRHG
jgi:hypothetical protein